ncbi:hypothetical protein Misp01_25810 [Microtetraspora sp. NBRC 13810]|uniref:Clp protease N-terminal domain-containing protein n=1 Tax=Microtetraspora sp. NBRC 13810 TaxID=3030990 RepID=UPI0024A09D62|nr:Clp protease N-terminal domain-containing protein [Microtetraspora sp. NBRC 13810]GLW07451.1 hypothetical protein Misp01_25810 [Microtetraspora sp. NBRC 13810]
MFERFTTAARHVVTEAQVESRALRHGHIGTEHLLLALLRATDRPPARILGELGLTHAEATAAILRYVGSDDLDADALGSIGIDLGAVREKIEETFGPGALDRPRGARRSPTGHIPFNPRAKKALELSLREALRLKHKHIADGHILLGILREGEGLAMKIIVEKGIAPETVRTHLLPHLIDRS